jgi:isopentenyl-diphosphate delta-isomerase
MAEQELIIFVDEAGKPTGEVGSKLECHNAETKLHLAFSCYVFRRSDHKFLVTQRAHSKKVWPGVWSNSFCGHPAPGEVIEAAIVRRGKFELGLTGLQDIRCILPKYVYITPPYNGIVEHEFCPIYVAYVDSEPVPNPTEVEAYKWKAWPEYIQILTEDADKMSWWCKDQYQHIEDIEPFVSLSN